jgi:hypothetical protein
LNTMPSADLRRTDFNLQRNLLPEQARTNRRRIAAFCVCPQRQLLYGPQAIAISLNDNLPEEPQTGANNPVSFPERSEVSHWCVSLYDFAER